MTTICLIVQAYYDNDARVRRKADALVAAGYSVDVLALRSPMRPRTYSLNGVTVRSVSLGKSRGTLARYLFEYAAFFAWTLLMLTVLTPTRRYSVVDVNTLPDFLIFAALPARLFGATLILDLHELTPEFFMSKYGVQQDSWFVWCLECQERASVWFADRVLTIHQPAEDLLVRRGLPKWKSTILMNSADEERFEAREPAEADCTDTGVNPPFILIYHGTLTRIYGVDVAVRAFGLACAEMPGAELRILGSGPETPRLHALVNELGLTGKVSLIGQVPPAEIPRWLGDAAVGILPIRRDVFLEYAFPNKLPELIVSGRAVIVSRLKTIRWYFSEAALAYAEPDDPGDFASQMIRLYRDPRLRAELCVRARAEYEPIRWATMKDRYVGLIAALLPQHVQANAVARRGR